MLYQKYEVVQTALKALEQLDENIVISFQEVEKGKQVMGWLRIAVLGYIVMDEKGKFVRQLADGCPSMELKVPRNSTDHLIVAYMASAFLWGVYNEIMDRYSK